jgi:DNA (cytosine-5)-methyltransferase 1
MPLTFGSLFAGIGGLDLGFERAGMVCKWQVEINEFCGRVLAKHWPNVRKHDDVRTFPPAAPDEWRVDVICGGFPCQDISASGTGKGIEGSRSGLWSEYARIIRVLRPSYVVVENSPLLTARGLSRVLEDLAQSGFDVEWEVLSACMFGAPHTRERMFVMAYTQPPERRPLGAEGRDLAHQHDSVHAGGQESPSWVGECLAAAARHWLREPDVARVAHGVPSRLDRLRGLGNAVVPAVAEYVGRRVVALDSTLRARAEQVA